MSADAGRPRAVYSWVLALLLPLFAVYVAVAYPIEESAYDAAAESISHVAWYFQMPGRMVG